jgi:S-DNA-T family DNA segregation ATPase FtsK/SpoIIIE
MASGGRSSTAKSSKNKAKTTAVKKNTSPAGKRKRTTKAKQQAANQLRDEVLVLLSFAVAVILLLSNFNLAGSVGVQIKWFMFGLFGVMEYIFPIVVAASLIFLISNREYIAVARVKTAAVYILMVLLSAMALRIGNRPDIAESTLMEIFHYSAVHNTGGGFFGGMLCKLLKPLGMFGSMVVLLLLIIICLIVITEKSFISGVMKMQKSGSRMVHAAKQDYDLYREHSADRQRRKPDEELSEEEYLARRREEKLKKIQEKEEKAQARMNKKARGITSATTLPKETAAESDNPIDIHEIVVDTQREDEYSGDIYSPVQQQEQAYDYELESILTEEPEEEMINPVETESMPDETIHGLSERLEQMTGQYQEPEMYPDAYAEDGVKSSAYEAYEQTLPEETVEQDMEQDGYEAENAEYPEPEVMGDAEETAGVSGQPHMKVQRYQFPPLSLLNQASSKQGGSQDRENKATALRLQQTLQNFGVKVTITDISCGPAVTRYELQPEQGVKVSKIVSLSDDIKLNLAAADIRIEAPIPGKAAIGIEVPNKVAGSVSIRELLESEAFEKSASPITFAVGKDIAGKTIVADIAKMPHLLIAGATGSGKSVCINTIIMSIIYKADPEEVKMIMIDPKMVELRVYDGIPHLMIPVVIDPKKASGALNWAVNEMTDRYKKFAQMGVRNLKGYNDEIAKMEVPEGEEPPQKMPQLVIIIDELADLMMVAPGEVEDAICRLAQLARAAGIHLVIATQRPSVNVITGLIKANVPSRIAFAVSSGVDSRTIIDMNGAEKLLGKGDMLFFPSGYPKPVRVQGAFVSDDEVSRVVDFLKENSREVVYDEAVSESITSTQSQNAHNTASEKDSYFAEAGRFIIEKEKGSIGMLQRYYKIGFNRAARIMDQLADAGVVGPEVGTKPRKVLMTPEEFETYLKQNT